MLYVTCYTLLFIVPGDLMHITISLVVPEYFVSPVIYCHYWLYCICHALHVAYYVLQIQLGTCHIPYI